MYLKKTKVLFLGRKTVAEKCLKYLVNSKYFEVVGVITDSELDESPTRDYAIKQSIPIYEYEESKRKIRDKELIFDLGISMLFWRKLTDEFISCPSFGTINFHPAPLPEYKGTAGYNLAILEELDSWGVTAHYVDECIDTGEIIKVKKFPICKYKETVKSLESTSQKYLFEVFKETLDKVVESRNTRLGTLPNVGGKYISRSDMEAMKEIKSGDDISRKIRAFWYPPYDGAYIIIGEEKYTLVDRDILNKLADGDISNVFGKKNV